jgi:hypothetical protein
VGSGDGGSSADRAFFLPRSRGKRGAPLSQARRALIFGRHRSEFAVGALRPHPALVGRYVSGRCLWPGKA